MTENERIKVLRKSLPDYSTLIKFATKIGVSDAAISQVETGKCNVSDRLRREICREFNVNEHWLRTGEGEMFRDMSAAEEIDRFIGDALADDKSFRAQLIATLAKLDDSEWVVLEAIAEKFVAEIENSGS